MKAPAHETDVAADAGTASRPAPHEPSASGLQNMQQLIQLRWIAVVGQIVTIGVVAFGFRISLPLDSMLMVLAALIAFNLLSQVGLQGRRDAQTGAWREVADGEVFIALLVDVAALTAQLYLSGGATNPFVFLYLLQVILAAELLQPRTTWAMVAVTGGCFAGLALLSRPLSLPLDQDRGLQSHYIQGMLICFALNAVLLAVYIKRIHRNLRARDARLADLRQRAAEEEHIVRIGLLASGAAHELGTPLATLSVILGDWRHMPAFKASPELLQEIGEMQTQLQRCKRIVSGILLSAGETRGESSVRTTVTTFLDDLVGDWRTTRGGAVLDYENRFGSDLPMVSDSVLAQMICNLLDNALEASPHWLLLHAVRDAGDLVLTVSDAGPGFPAPVLANFGTPYRSTKGRPGGGLGLFLVVNVARTLGGQVEARNRPEGGASVVLRLPLAAITLDGQAEGGRRHDD